MGLMHVLVTGASSGIGAAIAEAYLRQQAYVTVVARRRDRLEALASAHERKRCHIVVADLAEHASVAGVLASAEAEHGPVDILVNNAGIQILGRAHETPWARVEQLLHLNVFAPLRLTMAALPGMIERRRGTIVDIASMAALAPTPGMLFYNASKAALAAASESLRAEVAPHGVHVVTVYPGPVESDMESAARAAYTPSAVASRVPTGTPAALAALVVRAVERKQPRIIYPKVYGLSRMFPAVTRWVVDTFTPPLKQER
jgi:short-subunit dehydrogenase